jgi:hypothetical protein
MPITQTAGGGMTFDGPAAVNVYRMTVIASALRLYAKTGMKVNAAYTPKAMMATAAALTGQKFKARDYLGAADALTAAARAAAPTA